jgi:integration host factor subunit beta
VTRSSIADALKLKFPYLSQDDVDFCIELILDKIAKTIANKNRVEIRGFGTFFGVEHKAKYLRNPKTTESFWHEGFINPRFRQSKLLLSKNLDNTFL